MDFFYKKTFVPNIDAMQISSYHKQLGHNVNFVTEQFHIGMAFDLYYIIRTRKATPRPPGKLLDDKRVRTIGNTLREESSYWELPEIICSVRPDYLLYPSKDRDPYYNANRVRFYHKGNLIKLRQPFENTMKFHKKTIVVDNDFWEQPEENLVLTLTELLEYDNISFEAPIQLKKIIEMSSVLSLFLKMKFSPGTIFKFRNNYGSEYEDAEKLFAVITQLKIANNHVAFGKIPFKTVTKDHWDRKNGTENGIYDLIRCLRIMDLAKKLKISILFVKTDRQKLESPFWYYLDSMQYWSESFAMDSYVEYMLNSAVKKFKIPWYGILNNPLKWSNPHTKFLLSLITKKELKKDIDDLIYRQWGENFLDRTLINWQTVNTYRGKIEDDIQHGEE